MQRVTTSPRTDWPKVVESQGLLFHSIDGEPYWDETAYYLFEAAEIDQIEAATLRLDAMCLEAVEHVIRDQRLGEVGIPEPFHPFVARSWEFDERTIYGRFDLSYDGVGPPKLLEYNADTPTSLLEAAVIQWFWSRTILESLPERDREDFDQFNSIHERLIEVWGRVGREMGKQVVFAAISESLEDLMTVTYLRDTASQAGLQTLPIAIKQIGWNRQRGFTDLRERPIDLLFKLYPWEWLIHEPFGQNLPMSRTRWLEPPWKMVLSSKAILPILFELFPSSPYLLRAAFEPFGDTYVSKPIHSREGANIAIVERGQTIAATTGDYGDGPRIYQQIHRLPKFSGRFPVLGSWMVNGYACGIGIREDDALITTNTSRFLPHLFRKNARARPPVLKADSVQATKMGANSPTRDPLWDQWVDP